MDEKLLWISKRLTDISKEIDSLEEADKRYIIERAEKLDKGSLIELYNSIGEYAQL